ncbi:hypothetical protein TAMA11512_21740 [Selenomonas sp. TAMA-11512]|uniref:hypothetical protein n=1 Tax=Selenomonas sp. TAMA-11512 TaxID=3095337 RepID=UPI00308F610E|nr:hypothetical protein TAMA11512_21740 [Selenomonas sp. TAMA-11512]
MEKDAAIMPYDYAHEHIKKSAIDLLQRLNGLSYTDAQAVLQIVIESLGSVSTVNFSAAE